MIGSQPITQATGIGWPRAAHLTKCAPQCWPPLISRNGVVSFCPIMPRYRPTFITPVSGSLVTIDVEGVDVAAAFEIVPFRHRKFGLVDGLAADDDVLHRAGVDHHRRNGLAIFLHHVLDQFAVGGVVRKAEREREPRPRAEPAGEQLVQRPSL